MSILKAALNRENIERDHAKAVKLDQQSERKAAVAALHKVFLAEVGEVEKLSLQGDYNAKVAVPMAQKKRISESELERRVAAYGSAYCYSHGLELKLGSEIKVEKLVLAFTDRNDHSALQATLCIDRKHPYKTETIATFHGHSDPVEMLERFFDELAKHVVDVVTA